MRIILSFWLLFALLLGAVSAQNPPRPQRPESQIAPEDIIRISTQLVQADVVVTDKNENIIPDLKISDFELYDNGKKQEIKFMEFVGVESGRRAEGPRPPSIIPPEAEIGGGLKASQLKRVVAFVVDDLTIPTEDMATVREILTDFVNNRMLDGDLVAIVRVVGGRGLLQQFSADRQLLRRAIAALNVSTHPFAAFNNPPMEKFTSKPTAVDAAPEDITFEDFGLQNFNDPNDETVRLTRGLLSLSTASFVIDSMREIPGRKSLVLISGGIPIFELSAAGTAYSSVSYLLNRLTDNAVRAGVVINTMDPRGLKASPGVTSFESTPGRSALGGQDPTFGRGGSSAQRAETFVGQGLTPAATGDDPFGPLLAGAAEHLGLASVANATGGVSVVNTNNFREGLDRVLARSQGYYVLAYTPQDKFDKRFHRIEIKVKRDGIKVYSHRGYFAREETTTGPATKEESIMAAVKSPLARSDLDVAANFLLKPSPTGKATLDVHLLIDANKLDFKRTPDSKYQTSFDVVGFVYDQMGRVRGGFSETVRTNLTEENYNFARKTGLAYSATTELPPGFFQFRAGVREADTASMGTISRYFEIPDLSKGRLAMSSIFLFAANPAATQATPEPLLAVRRLSRKQDLRYAALIYNAKLSGNQPKVQSQMIISQGSKILYREPQQPVSATSASPITKIGQIALGKVSPGRYVLTLVVTDPLADKKSQTVARSIDFTVVD